MIEETTTIPTPPSELALSAEPAEPFIFRVVEHHHPTKKTRLQVNECVVEHGELPAGAPRFSAPIRQMPIGQGPQGQMITINGDIPVRADSLVEAFEMLPQILSEEVPKLIAAAKKQLTAPKIVVAGPTKNGEDFDWGGQKFKLGLSR